MLRRTPIEEDFIARRLIADHAGKNWEIEHPQTYRQLSVFDDFHLDSSNAITVEDACKSAWGQL